MARPSCLFSSSSWLIASLFFCACSSDAPSLADGGHMLDGVRTDGVIVLSDGLRRDTQHDGGEDDAIREDADRTDGSVFTECGGSAGIYVSPAGTGTDCSASAPCSLEQGKALVRQRNANMSADLIVCLRGGRYVLSQALIFEAVDSGSNGYNVVYRAFPGEEPVLSGASVLSASWTVFDAARQIYVAPLDSAGTRQLLVNGKWAQRARGVQNPGGYTKTATGYTTNDPLLLGAANPHDLEIVSHVEWKSFRCGVQSISGNQVTMDAPCWRAANWHAARPVGLPTWVENALIYLDEPGEWYFDQAAKKLYYKPRAGEDMAQVEVLVPALQSLLELHGSAANAVRDLHFIGLSFAHTTWLAPSSAEGYAPLQAGMRLIFVGNDPTPQQHKSASALTLRGARGIRFEGNTFIHLGAAALSLEKGSQHNVIIGNIFSDLAASALQLSDVQVADHHPSSAADIVLDNVIRGNIIRRVGIDYHDSLGILGGYAGQTHILHNELSELPYSAISLGWGWGAVDVGGAAGYTTPTPARENRIEGNKIADIMKILRDGGGVYMLGAQAGSVIKRNTIAEQHNDYAAIYLDNGARHFFVSENVVWQAPHWTYVQGWGTKALDNTLTENYYDAASPQMRHDPPNETDPSNIVTANHIVYAGLWPAVAQAVIASAGVEPDLTSVRAVAGGALVSASSEFSVDHAVAKANDGNLASGWSPTGTDAQPWYQLDLRTPMRIREVVATMRQDMDQPESRKDFEIRISNDPSFGSYLVLGTQGSTPLAHQGALSATSQRSGAFRYLRVAKTQPGYLFLAEVAVDAVP